MAQNIIYNKGDRLAVACTDPAVPASGDPVVYGPQLPGIALTNERADGLASVQFCGVASFPVKAVDTGGNAAVAEGDALFYVAADTPKLSKKNTGVRYGIAMGTVTSGATATINVRIGY